MEKFEIAIEKIIHSRFDSIESIIIELSDQTEAKR